MRESEERGFLHKSSERYILHRDAQDSYKSSCLTKQPVKKEVAAESQYGKGCHL